MPDTELVVARLRLPQLALDKQPAGPESRCVVVDQLGLGRIEHLDVGVDRREEDTLLAPHKLRNAVAGQLQAAVGGNVHAANDPLGVTDSNPTARGESPCFAGYAHRPANHPHWNVPVWRPARNGLARQVLGAQSGGMIRCSVMVGGRSSRDRISWDVAIGSGSSNGCSREFAGSWRSLRACTQGVRTVEAIHRPMPQGRDR